MITFRQHGPVRIVTVMPPLKESGRGAYAELWELDISPRRLMDRIHDDGRERASYKLGRRKCSASHASLSDVCIRIAEWRCHFYLFYGGIGTAHNDIRRDGASQKLRVPMGEGNRASIKIDNANNDCFASVPWVPTDRHPVGKLRTGQCAAYGNSIGKF